VTVAAAESDNRRQRLEVIFGKGPEIRQNRFHTTFFSKTRQIRRALRTEKTCQDIQDFPYILYSSSQPTQGGWKRNVRSQRFGGLLLTDGSVGDVDGLFNFV